MGVGADSIYAANVVSGKGSISGGAGADTFLISTLSDTVIYGGADQDSIHISGSLYGATVDFGAGNEQLTLLLVRLHPMFRAAAAMTRSWSTRLNC